MIAARAVYHGKFSLILTSPDPVSTPFSRYFEGLSHVILKAVNSCNSTRQRRLLADLGLLGVAAVWGVTFSVVKEATAELPAFHFLAIRFALAALVLVALNPRRFRLVGRKTGAAGPPGAGTSVGAARHAGVVIGAFLFGGYALQTLGLQTTTPSKAGFITGLAVVIVPLISALFWRERLPGTAVAGVVLATAGLGLLTLNGAGVGPVHGPLFRAGDLLVLGGALSFALHIIAVGKFSVHHDPVVLAAVQIAATSAASAIMAWVVEPPVAIPAIPNDVWWAIVLTGVFATSVAFLVQTTAQRFTSSTHTALIFTMEPVFAATYSYVFLGEPLTLRGLAGGLLVLAGMLVAQRNTRASAPH